MTDIDTTRITDNLSFTPDQRVHTRRMMHEDPQVTCQILTGNRAVSSGRVQPSSGAMLPGAAGELR